MIPGFKTLLRVQGRRLEGSAAEKWMRVSSFDFNSSERALLHAIEDAAWNLRSDERIIERTDYGVGSKGGNKVSVSSLARRASVSSSWGRLLFQLARVHRATNVLELGSCLGISGAYMQGALDLNGSGRFTTIEGDPSLCEITQATLSLISTARGQVVCGRFTDVLPEVLSGNGPFDLVFIDGHHNPDAVETYYRMIEPFLADEAIVVVDDIQPVTGAVRPAWNRLTRKANIAWFVNLIRMGILAHAPAQ